MNCHSFQDVLVVRVGEKFIVFESIRILLFSEELLRVFFQVKLSGKFTVIVDLYFVHGFVVKLKPFKC